MSDMLQLVGLAKTLNSELWSDKLKSLLYNSADKFHLID